MNTLLEHIYAIQNILNNGVPSDDHRLPNALVGHYLKINRAVLIKRKLDKERTLNNNNYYAICVPLELAPYQDCCLVDDDVNCKLLKSTIKIPRSISARWGFTYNVKYIDGTLIPAYTKTNSKLEKYSLSKKCTPTIGWFIKGDYLYVVGTTELPTVIVEFIPEDPEEVEALNICEGDNAPCVESGNSFSLDSDLIAPMYELTVKALLLAKSIPVDNLNNSRAVEIKPGLE